MKNNNSLQDFNDKPLTRKMEELERRSRERQRQFLPIIREKNKKLQEADIARETEKRDKRRQQIEALKGYLKEGKTWRECAKLMGCSTGFINTLRKEALASKVWLTQKELEKITELRNSRKKGNPRQEKDKKSKELIKQQKAIIATMDNYRKYKKFAKREDELELNGNENITTGGRKKFIEALIEMQRADIDIPNEDINIILNAYSIHPDIADVEGIKFLIIDAKTRGGIELVKMRISDLLDSLEDTEFYTPLSEYQQWIRIKMSYPSVLVSKEDSMNDSEVRKKLENCLGKANSVPAMSAVDWDMED